MKWLNHIVRGPTLISTMLGGTPRYGVGRPIGDDVAKTGLDFVLLDLKHSKRVETQSLTSS